MGIQQKAKGLYKTKVAHDAGSLLSVKYLLLLCEHKGYSHYKNVDENIFVVQHHRTGKKAMFFLAPPDLKVDIHKAYSIINRIKLQRQTQRFQVDDVIIVARRFEYMAEQVFRKVQFKMYSAQKLRQVSKKVLVAGASDKDAYASLKYGMSPPTYNLVRVVAGLFLLASAMVPAMIFGAWHNDNFLMLYPFVLTLVVGGFVSYVRWYMDLEFKEAITLLILFSAMQNFITLYIVPTYLL